jgi:hypothetical protein
METCMTDDYDRTVAAFRLACTALSKLTAEEIRLLADGKGSIAFLPLGSTIVQSGPTTEEMRSRLENIHNRQEATTYINGLKLKKAELQALARELGIIIQGKDSMATLRSKIIEGTVGTRADVAAIRGGSW